MSKKVTIRERKRTTDRDRKTDRERKEEWRKKFEKDTKSKYCCIL